MSKKSKCELLSADFSEPEFTSPINNVTVALGREAVLTCTVSNLGNYKVGWLRASDQLVLALQGRVITHNPRFGVSREDSNTWQLRIRQVKETDRGCYMCQINTSPMRKQTGCMEVQVPPDISDENSSSDVTAQEGQDANLQCTANGRPQPRVTWKREDGQPLLVRTKTKDLVRVDSFNGTVLHLSRVERRQMGAYLCIASNEVPPAVSKRVTLNVHFAPSVRAPSQLLGAPLDSDVHLECVVEASPAAVTYWLKGRPTTYASQEEEGLREENDVAGQLLERKPEMLLDG
ncbi:lachesin [Ctenocephalides felis]|uniref:lachesin n=1 Tax=Ctenocephalides felis TaxID=7515 RepID=UPI000E6E407B|nr:lachesin [Ctenocephalides felis]